MNDLQVVTLGHSSHPLGGFLSLLQKHDIQALADDKRLTELLKQVEGSRAGRGKGKNAR